MNKNFNDWFHDRYTPEGGYQTLIREFMHAENNGLAHNPIKLMHYIIDYHYSHLSMKDYIGELEGKIYELQETIDGFHKEPA